MQMFHVLRSAYFNYSIFGYPVTETQSMVFAVFMVFAILLCYDKWNRRPYETLANKLRGPPDYPIIGSCLEGLSDHYEKALNYGQSYNYGLFKLWAGNKLVVVISKPEDLQIIFNSSKALDKGFLYNMATKFLGEGLITAPEKCFQGLVETLMDSNEAGLGLSDEDIKSHVITIVAGGFETTSLTVSYCLLLLAIYPDIQNRV
ncbi:Cytochrome P450 [Cinara cedri]|uniref:Cytochrome P450 n=1 Tax=Cinara cedri TaxID=506608 RepID=A0A5E4N757_9HEMI|nr:Cytochrome P450 [Cinara cedri]